MNTQPNFGVVGTQHYETIRRSGVKGGLDSFLYFYGQNGYIHSFWERFYAHNCYVFVVNKDFR